MKVRLKVKLTEEQELRDSIAETLEVRKVGMEYLVSMVLCNEYLPNEHFFYTISSSSSRFFRGRGRRNASRDLLQRTWSVGMILCPLAAHDQNRTQIHSQISETQSYLSPDH